MDPYMVSDSRSHRSESSSPPPTHSRLCCTHQCTESSESPGCETVGIQGENMQVRWESQLWCLLVRMAVLFWLLKQGLTGHPGCPGIHVANQGVQQLALFCSQFCLESANVTGLRPSACSLYWSQAWQGFALHIRPGWTLRGILAGL